jgi:hypothetical protein
MLQRAVRSVKLTWNLRNELLVTASHRLGIGPDGHRCLFSLNEFEPHRNAHNPGACQGPRVTKRLRII